MRAERDGQAQQQRQRAGDAERRSRRLTELGHAWAVLERTLDRRHAAFVLFAAAVASRRRGGSGRHDSCAETGSHLNLSREAMVAEFSLPRQRRFFFDLKKYGATGGSSCSAAATWPRGRRRGAGERRRGAAPPPLRDLGVAKPKGGALLPARRRA